MKTVNCFLYPFFLLANLSQSNFSETEKEIEKLNFFSRRNQTATPNLLLPSHTSEGLLPAAAAS